MVWECKLPKHKKILIERELIILKKVFEEKIE